WLPADFPPKELKGKRVAQNAVVVGFGSENADGPASDAVDGFADTIWHSRWSGNNVPGCPHELVVDLGATMELSGLTVLPRQTGVNGWINEYEVYVSQDGKTWGEPAAKGAFDRGKEKKTVQFANPAICRFIRFVALKGFDNQVWASLAELEVVLAK
ncbi:MAG: discoidin domain-containing protein, partial [Armatimonadetes bacterium]|nr:discoidin domain-containing protein [Armatimonadota bacterium]